MFISLPGLISIKFKVSLSKNIFALSKEYNHGPINVVLKKNQFLKVHILLVEQCFAGGILDWIKILQKEYV